MRGRKRVIWVVVNSVTLITAGLIIGCAAAGIGAVAGGAMGYYSSPHREPFNKGFETFWGKPIYHSPIGGTPVLVTGEYLEDVVYPSDTAHLAIDIGLEIGTPVYATEASTITYIGPDQYGKDCIRMKTLYTEKYLSYGYVRPINVSVGDTVAPGQQIGITNASGTLRGGCLHFVTQDTPSDATRYNPIIYLIDIGIPVYIVE